MRTLASLTGYFYAVRDHSLYVNLYAQSEGKAEVGGTEVGLRQTTNYPWAGTVSLAVSPAKPPAFALRLRIPEWVQGHPVPTDLYSYEPGEAKWSARVNGQEATRTLEQGYSPSTGNGRPVTSADVDFSMPVRLVHGNEQIAATRGEVAFERGPIVYCVEAIQQDCRPSR